MEDSNVLSSVNSFEILATDSDEISLIKERFQYIREEVKHSPYIEETLRVLTVGGYRSAIGSFWNAVVDDLRNKILFRSLDLFNKEMNTKVSTYEDFQENVNDETLIEGAYKIGVIDWEARKILKQAKETRHIFDGHPRSSNPSFIKALSMMEDCIKYVLSQEYPPHIINITEYIANMALTTFDRNEFSISEAISNLPNNYQSELINRLFSSYIKDDCSSIMRSNIEIVSPILWKELQTQTKRQLIQRVDQVITDGNTAKTNYAFKFVILVGGKEFLSTRARKYKLGPCIDKLLQNLDVFSVENECVDELSQYAGYIPQELLFDYVNGLTQTYVGSIGHSPFFPRTDFYADLAANKIPRMFESFDDESSRAFIACIKSNSKLQQRILNDIKFDRLRTLGEIVYSRISENFEDRHFLEVLLNKNTKKEFFDLLYSGKKKRRKIYPG